jgi:hypothetical protein
MITHLEARYVILKIQHYIFLLIKILLALHRYFILEFLWTSNIFVLHVPLTALLK